MMESLDLEDLKPAWIVVTTVVYSVASFALFISAALRLQYAIGYDASSKGTCVFPRIEPYDDDRALYVMFVPWTIVFAHGFVRSFVSGYGEYPVTRKVMHMIMIACMAVANIIAVAIHFVVYCTPAPSVEMETYVETGLNLTAVYPSFYITEIVENKPFIVALWTIIIVMLLMDLRIIRQDGRLKAMLVPFLKPANMDHSDYVHNLFVPIIGTVTRIGFLATFCALFGRVGYGFPHGPNQYRSNDLGEINYVSAMAGDFTPLVNDWLYPVELAMITLSNNQTDKLDRIPLLKQQIATECYTAIKRSSESSTWGKFESAYAYAGMPDVGNMPQAKKIHIAITVALAFAVIELIGRIGGILLIRTKKLDEKHSHQLLDALICVLSLFKIFGCIMVGLAMVILSVQNTLHTCPVFTYRSGFVQYMLLGTFAAMIVDHLITSFIDSTEMYSPSSSIMGGRVVVDSVTNMAYAPPNDKDRNFDSTKL